MRRREFITLLGGAAAAWPLAARAQPPIMPVIGYLDAGSPEPSVNLVAALRRGLSEMGYVEGQNIAIQYRWAEGQNDRLPELAADLTNSNVAAIAAPGSSAPALALKRLTATIPIIFSTGADPVRIGLIASLNRPGGNITGIASMSVEVGEKRLEFLCQLVPRAVRLALLTNPTVALSQSYSAEFHAAGAALGRQTEVFTATTNGEIDSAFVNLVKYRADGLAVIPDALFNNRRFQLAGLAMRHAIPAIFPFRQYAEAGGLMSYGSDIRASYRHVGIYTGRILKGDKPADLPVIRHSKFELLINMQTARTLGLEVPSSLLALADEVIE
jgi:putative tryptophan/tyrosine transport system substrate-binding protein